MHIYIYVLDLLIYMSHQISNHKPEIIYGNVLYIRAYAFCSCCQRFRYLCLEKKGGRKEVWMIINDTFLPFAYKI